MAEQTDRRPAVIVEDAHVKYKVLASSAHAVTSNRRRPFRRPGRTMSTVHALKGITFTAFEQDSIGVVGSNGSGKSTLLRAISGLTPLSSGEIWATSRPSLLGVGAALIKDLSGAQNVILGGLALGMSREEINEQFDAIVEFADLRDAIHRPMRTYSSGMTARLKFAIATSKQHEILIVDEALAVGDQRFRARSEERIRHIRDNAGTVFLVSHSAKSIIDTCNRVIWIEKGVQLMDGPPRRVLRAYRSFHGVPIMTKNEKALNRAAVDAEAARDHIKKTNAAR